MDPILVGIDIGTGSTKAVALNRAGKILQVVQHAYPFYSPHEGFHEQDPDLIWKAFLDCLKEIRQQLGAAPAAICLSSAMHSLIPVDATGKALCRMITWADTRSDKIALELLNSPDGKSLYESTGTPLHPMSPLCKIIWIRQNKPEIFSAATKYISIKEYIWYRLFGKYQIDHSIASATGLFNIASKTWNARSLELAGITEAQLSVPVPTAFTRKDPCKELSALLDLTPDTNFTIGASDGCLANLGSFAIEPGTASLTIGTSGAVRVGGDQPTINFGAMIFNYILDEETIISGGAVNNGGNTLQWFLQKLLKKQVLSPEVYQQLEEEVSGVRAGSDNLIFLPYLNGERAPIWDPESCGTFFGIKPTHGTGHFARAILEGVCFALNDVLKMVEESGRVVNRLNVSGGFVHSASWLQILADITGKKVAVVQSDDASAIGAGFMAMRAAGLIKDYSELEKPPVESIFVPGENTNRYQKQFQIYKQLYGKLKHLMHELSEMEAN